MVGWYLRLRFVEEDNQPELVFVPFRNQGPALCGMRPERLANWDVHQNTWKSLVAGVNGNRPKRFKVQYLYERISE